MLSLHQREIARFVHAQMQKHYWEDDSVESEVVARQGFMELKASAYSTADPTLDFRQSPADKSNMHRSPSSRWAEASRS